MNTVSITSRARIAGKAILNVQELTDKVARVKAATGAANLVSAIDLAYFRPVPAADIRFIVETIRIAMDGSFAERVDLDKIYAQA